MAQVSIIMAVFNGAGYVPAAIESILSQGFTDFEFVIVDDGSNAATRKLLRGYAQADARICLHLCEHRGLSASLNFGLAQATAPLVARMDADDVSLPGRLATQVQHMQRYPDCVLLGTSFELIDAHGRLLTERFPPQNNDALQRHCLEGRCPIIHSAAMFRRDAAQQVGGYDERFAVAQDLDLWLRLGELGDLASLPDVLVRYRMHAHSLSEQQQARQAAETRAVCEAAWARRGTTCLFKGSLGWRPLGDPASQLRQVLKYGWWAFQSGERSTARSYGLQAIRMNPLASQGYRLLYASLKPQPLRRRSPKIPELVAAAPAPGPHEMSQLSASRP